MKARAATAALFVLASFAAAAQAAPPTKAECAAAHQEAQRLRSAGDLRGARARLLVCSRDPCPRVVEDECLPWLAEVERAMPTLVLEARTAAGRDVPDVRVLIDDRPVVDRLDGRALDVNPGEHRLRFEPARSTAIEQTIVVAEGEKRRIVRIEVAGDSAPPPAPAPSPIGPPPPSPDAAPGGAPRAALVSGGVGIVALGGFTFFALSGLSGEHGLRDCSPTCSDARITDVERRYVAADIFLGVGIVAVAATVYFVLTSR